MTRKLSLKLAIGQDVLLTGTEHTGFIKQRNDNGLYMVGWDDGEVDTLEHESELMVLPDER